MSANHPQDLLIPSVFVGESAGRSIIEAYLYDHDYALVITDDIPFNISNNLIIPFAIVVGLCFIIMVSPRSGLDQAQSIISTCVRARPRVYGSFGSSRTLVVFGLIQNDYPLVCLMNRVFLKITFPDGFQVYRDKKNNNNAASARLTNEANCMYVFPADFR